MLRTVRNKNPVTPCALDAETEPIGRRSKTKSIPVRFLIAIYMPRMASTVAKTPKNTSNLVLRSMCRPCIK